MTVLVVSALLMTGQAEIPSYMPAALRNTRDYEYMSHAVFRRKSDMASIRLLVDPSSQEAVDRGVKVAVKTAPENHKAFSEMPLARKVFSHKGPVTMGLTAIGLYERAAGNLTYKVRQISDRNKVDEDALFLEGVVRTSLARYASRRLSYSGFTPVAGTDVRIGRSEGANATLIDLQAWASARRIDLRRNTEAGSASFVYNGITRIVLLGSEKAKVGAEWRQLPDIMMEKDDRWFVPTGALE